MKNTTQLQNRFLERLEGMEKPALPWRAGLWQQGHDVFKAGGLPTKKWERYRYTPIELRIAALFADGWSETLPSPPPAIPASPVMQLPGHHIVLQDGDLLPHTTLPQGVSLTPFSSLSQAGHQWIKKPFDTTFPGGKDPWEALNAAFFKEGTCLWIAENTQVKTPIFLHHNVAVEDLTMRHPRLHFHLGRQAQAEIVEVLHLQGGGTLLQNSVIGITLDRGATLYRYLWSTELGAGGLYLHQTKVVAGAASHFWDASITLGEGFMRHALDIALVGEQAKATLYGGYIGHGRGHIEHSSVITHEVPNTSSTTLYKGLVDGHSTGVFYSSEHVGHNATGTTTSQYHHGWALDDRAHLYARPELFIHRDEVACQHGATMKEMDEAQLFYLTARGIPRSEAKTMLLKAFLQDIIGTLATPTLQRHIEGKTERALDGLG